MQAVSLAEKDDGQPVQEGDEQPAQEDDEQPVQEEDGQPVQEGGGDVHNRSSGCKGSGASSSGITDTGRFFGHS